VFKGEVVAEAGAIEQQIVLAAERRIAGLLSGARRAGQLAIGADAVEEALRGGQEGAALVVVARDAAAATKLAGVGRAIAKGAAIPFADKGRLGEVLGHRTGESREVAVVAVLHPGVADAIASTYRMSGPFMGMSRSEEAWSSSSEVR
jgi:ribosomal protein L7Ae-like RNA K-turn-binding protein